MRARRRRRASASAGAALVAAALALPAHADPLAFTAGGERHEVAPAGLASVAFDKGLNICLTDAASRALVDFTARHLGETVAVDIGATNVVHLKLLKPFAGGCINWPVHPEVGRRYQALLARPAP
jgi:ferric-dicitrate binding protein FerR (iron transport regulator)